MSLHAFPMLLVHQWFDNNGEPAAQFELYTYEAGTSNPKDTYLDADLTTPNTNPIIMDDAGRCTIFICPGEAYKLIFKDPDGNVLWTRDDWSIPGVEDAPAAAEVPVGGIIMYGGLEAPEGWLLCDGSSLLRADYPDLFAIVGTTFGSVDGTHFTVPDMRGRFPMGVAASGTGSTLGATAGAIDHVHAGPSHTHTIAGHTHTMAHTHSVPRDGWGSISNGPPVDGRVQTGGSGVGSEAQTTQATQDNTTGAASTATTSSTALTTDAAGTGNTGTANPPLLALNFIIRAESA